MRLRSNFKSGALASGILIGTTSMSETSFSSLPTVNTPDVLAVVLDPAATAGAPEVILITAHTNGNPAATVLRGQEGTTARAHLAGVAWVHGPTMTDSDYLYEPPTISVAVSGSGAQNLAHNTATAFTFTAEQWKDGLTHSTVTDNHIVEIVDAGIYDIDVYCGWDAHVSGTRYVDVRANNVIVRALPRVTPLASGEASNQLMLQRPFAVGDQITMTGLQTSGGNLLAYPGLTLTWRRGLA